MSSKQSTSIDISQLPIPQLNQLSQQLEQEIEFISNSLSQLKMVQNKFSESQESIKKLTPEAKDKDILVPLTSSMYVAGQLLDVDNVLVDIGTGYFVEKSHDEALEYYKRKVTYLTKQMEKLQPVLQEKYKMKQVVMEVLQMKVQSQMAMQQQTAGGK